MNSILIALITQVALLHNIEPKLALALVQVESSFNVNAISEKGAVGIMQVMPENYPEYSKEELISPVINIELGMRLLEEAKNSCPYKSNLTWLLCYNLGYHRAKKVKYPKLFPYYKEVMRQYRKAG